jgi:hypothetical protein
MAAGDRLIVLSDQGELSVVRANPAKFELLARFQVIGGKCWTSPVLAQGRLYVRNAKGPLGAVDCPNGDSASVQLLIIKPSNCCFQDAVWSPAGTTTCTSRLPSSFRKNSWFSSS